MSRSLHHIEDSICAHIYLANFLSSPWGHSGLIAGDRAYSEGLRRFPTRGFSSLEIWDKDPKSLSAIINRHKRVKKKKVAYLGPTEYTERTETGNHGAVDPALDNADLHPRHPRCLSTSFSRGRERKQPPEPWANLMTDAFPFGWTCYRHLGGGGLVSLGQSRKSTFHPTGFVAPRNP